MDSLVSVVIPVYNVENYLEEAVISVCEQSYDNIEIILVDDGSTDNSGFICNKLALNDNRIRVIHKINGGLSTARNVGIENAIGDYILFIDSDDFIERNTIRLLLDGFTKHENIGIVSAPCFVRYNKGVTHLYKEEWNIHKERIISYNDFCISTLNQTTCHSACCKLYRSMLFDKIRFREGKKNEDTLFMFDLSSIMCKLKLNMLEIADKLYYYRINDESITRNELHPIQIDIIENLLDLINETSNISIIKILKNKYYIELISFYSTLVTSCHLRKNIQPHFLIETERLFNEINTQDLFKYTSLKIYIKYYLMKYFKKIYIIMIRLKT